MFGSKDLKIKQLSEKINAMERSTAWRVAMTVEKIANLLLPQGTLRRRVYNWLIEKIQTILNDGIGAIATKENKKNTNTILVMSKMSKVALCSIPLERYSAVFPRFDHPLVSIIILTFNQVEFTLQCIDSLLKNTNNEIPFEIIVIDNNSQDQTLALLKKLKNITVLYNNKNVGYPAGCNQGSRLAQGEYLLFLNNDTIVTRGWLQPLIQTMENIKDCGAVGSKLVSFTNVLNSVGAVIWNNGTCEEFGRGGNPNDPEYSYLRVVDHCAGACLLLRKEVFDKIGGLDEQYGPGYYEDVDLSMALEKYGYKTYCQPLSVVYHNEHTSSSESNIKQLVERNWKIFTAKWQNELLRKPKRIHDSSR